MQGAGSLNDATASIPSWLISPRLRLHGERWRASYAANPETSRGRLHDEAESLLRSPFQRDRDRIIHSNAFRRLKHKTQVFVYHEGDHFRTRLTHTLEVAQIARSIARPLGLDEDLAEAIALAHDLGHPPFGHAGERSLDKCLSRFGGFDHNAQSLRAVTQLEKRYPDFDGLNLTWETLEGLIKHNGPLTDAAGEPLQNRQPEAIPYAIGVYREIHDLHLHGWPGLEAQIASISDDIAYDSHDIEDGLRAGLLTLDDLQSVRITGRLISEIRRDCPGLDETRLVHELVRRLITIMVEDVIRETCRRLDASEISTLEDIHAQNDALVGFSARLQVEETGLKDYLFANLYRSVPVQKQVSAAEIMVDALFTKLHQNPGMLPDPWRRDLDVSNPFDTARRVADYIAGMTDRFAAIEHSRLFDAG
jgi:dGTPase